MDQFLRFKKQGSSSEPQIHLFDSKTDWKSVHLDAKSQAAIKRQFKAGLNLVCFHDSTGKTLVQHFAAQLSNEKDPNKRHEANRLLGLEICRHLNNHKISSCHIDSHTAESKCLPVVEGIALANYQFLKYKADAKLKNSLQRVNVDPTICSAKELKQLVNVLESVSFARDLVNEPLSYLTAPQMAKEFQKMGKAAGLKVKVLNKKAIEKMKFGGLLAVNFGSIDPPTYTIMEWKPSKAVNKKPLILVGKGVVYDTGGLSLKPTEGMDHMKCDMGGAAAVAGAMRAIATNKLPVHTIALIPATDNRPGLNAYVPGDVITMHDGTTVEVMNTDAEGRMLLADALSHAKSYKPELVIDLATLTGAALRTLGQFACAMMGNAEAKDKQSLQEAGFAVHERVAEMPFWDDYKNLLKSDIADLKNIGGKMAGHITAGKFLEHFTDYPYIHLDIAPVAWSYSQDAYRLKNGTGFGVRLLFEFVQRKYGLSK